MNALLLFTFLLLVTPQITNGAPVTQDLIRWGDIELSCSTTAPTEPDLAVGPDAVLVSTLSRVVLVRKSTGEIASSTSGGRFHALPASAGTASVSTVHFTSPDATDSVHFLGVSAISAAARASPKLGLILSRPFLSSTWTDLSLAVEDQWRRVMVDLTSVNEIAPAGAVLSSNDVVGKLSVATTRTAIFVCASVGPAEADYTPGIASLADLPATDTRCWALDANAFVAAGPAASAPATPFNWAETIYEPYGASPQIHAIALSPDSKLTLAPYSHPWTLQLTSPDSIEPIMGLALSGANGDVLTHYQFTLDDPRPVNATAISVITNTTSISPVGAPETPFAPFLQPEGNLGLWIGSPRITSAFTAPTGSVFAAHNVPDTPGALTGSGTVRFYELNKSGGIIQVGETGSESRPESSPTLTPIDASGGLLMTMVRSGATYFPTMTMSQRAAPNTAGYISESDAITAAISAYEGPRLVGSDISTRNISTNGWDFTLGSVDAAVDYGENSRTDLDGVGLTWSVGLVPSTSFATRLRVVLFCYATLNDFDLCPNSPTNACGDVQGTGSLDETTEVAVDDVSEFLGPVEITFYFLGTLTLLLIVYAMLLRLQQYKLSLKYDRIRAEREREKRRRQEREARDGLRPASSVVGGGMSAQSPADESVKSSDSSEKPKTKKEAEEDLKYTGAIDTSTGIFLQGVTQAEVVAGQVGGRKIGPEPADEPAPKGGRKSTGKKKRRKSSTGSKGSRGSTTSKGKSSGGGKKGKKGRSSSKAKSLPESDADREARRLAKESKAAREADADGDSASVDQE